MKKVIVTGACGFIGSHITEFLIEKGFHVIAFDRYNNDNDFGWLNNSKFKKDIEFVLGDIRDFDSVQKCMKNSKLIFHLAALIGIPYSYISPLAYIKTNIEGTYNVLESAKNFNYDQVILTSTSETYGTAQYTPINEEHPLVGQSPYAASKISADQLAISYFKSFSLPLKIVRPFNTYGPRQSFRAIIPSIILQMLRGNEIYVGNIESIRDFNYVLDVCNAFYCIYKTKKAFGEIINVGSNKSISVEVLIKILSKIFNKTYNVNIDKSRLRPKNSEVNELICDNSKILNLTNWKTEYELNQGLKKTIQFFKKEDFKIKSDYHE